MKRVTGDLGVTSGLVATNGKELDILKHKGDRNYYDLNLTKGAKPTPISGISLQLKKADTKHSKYTLLVESDDKKIEKKDKNLDEPVQFYTGKDKLLYELVINTINKNQVIGYLATPKNAPPPDALARPAKPGRAGNSVHSRIVNLARRYTVPGSSERSHGLLSPRNRTQSSTGSRQTTQILRRSSARPILDRAKFKPSISSELLERSGEGTMLSLRAH